MKFGSAMTANEPLLAGSSGIGSTKVVLCFKAIQFLYC